MTIKAIAFDRKKGITFVQGAGVNGDAPHTVRQGSNRRYTRRLRSRTRLAMERLEDRRVLATFWVSTLGNDANGR